MGREIHIVRNKVRASIGVMISREMEDVASCSSFFFMLFIFYINDFFVSFFLIGIFIEFFLAFFYIKGQYGGGIFVVMELPHLELW